MMWLDDVVVPSTLLGKMTHVTKIDMVETKREWDRGTDKKHTKDQLFALKQVQKKHGVLRCMRTRNCTRNSNFPSNSNVTIPRRRNRGRAPNIVEPELRTIVAPITERTMEELLRAPTEGYGEAIVLPKINADHFEI
ncbi:hypothetical protein Tco_1039395 [Tanacetum coccineum]